MVGVGGGGGCLGKATIYTDSSGVFTFSSADEYVSACYM